MRHVSERNKGLFHYNTTRFNHGNVGHHPRIQLFIFKGHTAFNNENMKEKQTCKVASFGKAGK